MAALKYTGEELITACRDIGMVPDTGSTGTEDADLLKKINEGMRLILVPRLLKTREEYFVKRQRDALTTKARYRLPHRAMYSKLRDLWYVDSDGDRHELFPVEAENIHEYQQDDAANEPVGYVIEDNDVLLIPDTSTSWSGYLEFVFFMRPGDIVKTTSAGAVASFDTGAKTITCTADVSSLFSAGDKIDVHSKYSGGELKEWDLTVTNVATTVITVSEAIDASTYGRKAIEAGDYVCLAEESALPALPREMHPLVARAAALYVSESIGDMNGAQLHAQLLERGLGDAVSAVESRVEGKPMRLGGRKGMIGY